MILRMVPRLWLTSSYHRVSLTVVAHEWLVLLLPHGYEGKVRNIHQRVLNATCNYAPKTTCRLLIAQRQQIIFMSARQFGVIFASRLLL
ncbi:MAG: hypothetical protein CM15mP46_4460 [Alphaproteobacteria bacterium]|nr:MAG: hypothetical protein CM15mP46_4460 [Alphaproteobacteria bacterium]